jgi:hypothetical protein
LISSWFSQARASFRGFPSSSKAWCAPTV